MGGLHRDIFSLEETMMRIGLHPDYEEHCLQHIAIPP
jgi:hypothetical protein